MTFTSLTAILEIATRLKCRMIRVLVGHFVARKRAAMTEFRGSQSVTSHRESEVEMEGQHERAHAQWACH